jgi:hypothetical protein
LSFPEWAQGCCPPTPRRSQSGPPLCRPINDCCVPSPAAPTEPRESCAGHSTLLRHFLTRALPQTGRRRPFVLVAWLPVSQPLRMRPANAGRPPPPIPRRCLFCLLSLFFIFPQRLHSPTTTLIPRRPADAQNRGAISHVWQHSSKGAHPIRGCLGQHAGFKLA